MQLGPRSAPSQGEGRSREEPRPPKTAQQKGGFPWQPDVAWQPQAPKILACRKALGGWQGLFYGRCVTLTA